MASASANPDNAQPFCCGGCRAAWHLLHDQGMAEFYRMRAAGAPTIGRPAQADPGADAFDTPAFRATWTHALANGDEVIAWYLDGLHCPACVWLVEQLPRLLPGVRWARLDLGTAALRVAYDPTCAGPGAQARLLAALGYRARPFRSDAVSHALVAEHRSLLLRVAVAAASAVGAMHLAATLTAGELTGDLSRMWQAGFAWGALILALPGCLWAAAPLHRGALVALRARRWSVDLAASLVIILALLGSAALALGDARASYADAAAMFAALLLAARLAVVTARRTIVRAAGGLHHLLPHTAWQINDGRVTAVAASQLTPGDIIELQSDRVMPGDGTVIAGEASVDVAVLTGEPRPIAMRTGTTVAAGSICRSGKVSVRLDAVGSDTRLARMLHQALPAERRDERDQAATALRWLAPVTVVIALVAGLWWGEHTGWVRGAEVALAVIVAACPCAIGIAAPLVQALTTAAAAQRGILLRDPSVLERLAAVGEIVCDKTGTLSEGRMQVITMDLELVDPAVVLAATERSGHPVSLAIADALRQRGIVPVPLADWREESGRGVIARTNTGHDLRVGGSALTGVGGSGGVHTRIGVQVDGRLLATIDLGDPLRPQAHELIATWKASGAAIHIASGDHQLAVTARALELGIDPAHAHGGLTAEQKAHLVRERAAAPHHDHRSLVAAVGDGVNDAAMLAAADVAIGVSGGLEATLDRCQAYCTHPNSAGPAELWRGAAAARATVRRLLWISAIYNVIAIVGAAAGLFGPLVCAVAMPLSSATVVILAMRARCF